MLLPLDSVILLVFLRLSNKNDFLLFQNDLLSFYKEKVKIMLKNLFFCPKKGIISHLKSPQVSRKALLLFLNQLSQLIQSVD